VEAGGATPWKGLAERVVFDFMRIGVLFAAPSRR
jgi:hypothetical protein